MASTPKEAPAEKAPEAVEPVAAPEPEAKAAEPEAKDEPKAEKSKKASGDQRYVVTVDAIVIETGRSPKNEPVTTRALHGTIIEGSPNDARIKAFLASKSITKERKDGSKPRATAAMVTQAFGSEEDPVALPRADVQPSGAIGQ